ncbi:MAG: PQQ-like beta-propeller repeat protein, partial [Phycisphaerae bacterium]|nr:PQQ-like beta-propeller repeat protein [Phycisphaerae bacterium]
MNKTNRKVVFWVGCLLFLVCTSGAIAQDWPQWLGPNRDGAVTGFAAPQTWPATLTQGWKTPVGQGCSSPVLMGDKLYVFSRVGENEVLQCLNAATGVSLWQESYAVPAFSGPDARAFMGPRSTPAVAQGKIVTLGVTGILSCFNTADHKLVWRKDDFPGKFPRFHTSASPLIADGMCIAFVGATGDGGLVAYDLASGDRKWAWTQDGPAYGSPVMATIDGVKTIVTLSDTKVVAVNATNGALLWEVPYEVPRRAYNAATPIVNGQTMIYAGQGRGTTAVKLSKDGAKFAAEQLWSNPDNTVQYNTPVLKNGQVFSLSSQDSLVCINAKDGKTAWANPVEGGRGYASILDAGSALIALTPKGQLIVFEPSASAFKQLASYQVGSDTYACPAISGNRIFVKDADS